MSRAPNAAAFRREVAAGLGVAPEDLTWKQVLAGARRLKILMNPAVEVESRRVEWDGRKLRIDAKIAEQIPPTLCWSPDEARCLLRAHAMRLELAMAADLDEGRRRIFADLVDRIRVALRHPGAPTDPLASREAFERFCALELNTTPAHLRALPDP